MPGVMEDRDVWVQPHQHVRTEWIDIDACVLGSRARMDFAAIERAGRKLLQQGGCQSIRAIVGHWRDDGRFSVDDGRHEYLAALALGRRRLLVSWVEAV